MKPLKPMKPLEPLAPLTPREPREPITSVIDPPGEPKPKGAMTLSEAGGIHLMQWEGAKPIAYRDVAGHLTIGVGHLLTEQEHLTGEIWIGGAPVEWAHGLTDARMLALLQQDADQAEACVNERVEVPLTQGQFDALVSFVFNVGCYAFASSTLLRELNAGNYGAVPGELRRWNKAGGEIIPGLVNRREAEIELWNA